MEHEVSSDLVQKCICYKWFTILGHLVCLPNWLKCRFSSSQAPITHELVTAPLQTAVWSNVEYYSRHTTQKVQRLYPIALRKHRVAHYLTRYSTYHMCPSPALSPGQAGDRTYTLYTSSYQSWDLFVPAVNISATGYEPWALISTMTSLTLNSNPDSTNLSVPKLCDDGSNWADYSLRIQKTLGFRGLWKHVEGTAIAPKPYALAKWQPRLE